MSSEIFSVNESPPEKPKLDDVDIIQKPPEREDDSSDNEGFEHMTDEEMKEYRLYCEQLNESNGFDVDFAPRAYRRIIGSHTEPCNLADPEAFEMIQKCTQFVIERYNQLMKGKSRLQLVQIARANWSYPGYMYNANITFDAEDTVSTLSGTYQTLICHYPYVEQIYALSLRKKGQNEDFYFPVDLDDKEECMRMNKCAEVAVSEYNEIEGESVLELMKVAKAVQEIRSSEGPEVGLYWVTFEAKDTKLGQINKYFAETEYDPKDENIKVFTHVQLKKDKW